MVHSLIQTRWTASGGHAYFWWAERARCRGEALRLAGPCGKGKIYRVWCGRPVQGRTGQVEWWLGGRGKRWASEWALAGQTRDDICQFSEPLKISTTCSPKMVWTSWIPPLKQRKKEVNYCDLLIDTECGASKRIGRSPDSYVWAQTSNSG